MSGPRVLGISRFDMYPGRALQSDQMVASTDQKLEVGSCSSENTGLASGNFHAPCRAIKVVLVLLSKELFIEHRAYLYAPGQAA
jgi:hypothetical protein